MLDELEFGSSKTLDVHLHFLQPGQNMRDDYAVQEFCIVGSQGHTLAHLRQLVPPGHQIRENMISKSNCPLLVPCQFSDNQCYICVFDWIKRFSEN